MHTFRGWSLVALAGLASLTLIATPTVAQIKEAQAAFNSAVREAQKVLRGKPRRRKARRLRKSIHESRKQKPAGPPIPNPKRAQALATKPGVKASPGVKVSGKASAKTTAAAVLAVSAATDKPDAKPDPNVWTTKKIKTAMRACRRTLKGIQANVAPVAPIKRGPCGDAAPVQLTSLGGARKVMFQPAPVLNCKMVRALDIWLRRGLQPLARKHLGAPIVKVSVMSSYSCRNAYGRKGGRLSEHGKANALDIGGFVTADGQKTALLAHWGPTERDIIAAARKEKDAATKRAIAKTQSNTTGAPARVQARIPAAPALAVSPAAISRRKPSNHARTASVPPISSTPAPARAGRTRRVRPDARDGIGSLGFGGASTVQQQVQSASAVQPLARETPVVSAATLVEAPSLSPPIPERRRSLRQRWEWAKATRAKRSLAGRRSPAKDAYRSQLNNFLSYRNDLGGPKPKGGHAKNNRKRPAINRAAFLRGAHRTACRIFGTVLGPEANDAHRNHFHVDLAPRRRSNYCR